MDKEARNKEIESLYEAYEDNIDEVQENNVPILAEKNTSLIKKIVRIIGMIIAVLGMLAIMLSVFTAVNCFGTAIMIIIIGFIMIWTTEDMFGGC